MTHYHLVGIGGTGLSAIARVLLEKGETVTGSDRQISTLAESLKALGGRVFQGHSEANIQGADYIIRSSAVPDDNVELHAAREAGIPILKRAEFLPLITQGHKCIAVAGTHGKTTTTAMIAWVLTALGQDPSYIIGSVANNMHRNARAGFGNTFVIEADEYDRMFLGLSPSIAVVTNVEHDHPDYFPTEEDFRRAFVEFADRLLPDGILLSCADDAGARWLSEDSVSRGKKVQRYGLDDGMERSELDFLGRSLESNRFGGFSFEFMSFRSHREDSLRSVKISLQVPGRHNVANATAALAVVDSLGLSLQEAGEALEVFRGTARRFDVRGEAQDVIVIDDYAHHPTEIKATLSAARARYPERELWVVWQPHTYSRTRTFLDEFTSAFRDADRVLVTDIYAAREVPSSNGFSSQDVVENIEHRDVRYMPGLVKSPDWLVERLQPGAVLVVLSAGDADRISKKVLDTLREKDFA